MSVQEGILTKMPMPTAGERADRPAVPAITPLAPRALTVAPALPINPDEANVNTSQHPADCTEDEIYQRHKISDKALTNLDDLQGVRGKMAVVYSRLTSSG